MSRAIAVVGALVIAALTAVVGPSATVAHAGPVEALLIGDSVLDGLAQSYGAEGRALLAARHSYILDAAGCRRLITTSCHIGSGPTPTNAITELRTHAGLYDGTLVVAAGYDDPSTGTSGIGAAVDVMLAEAQRQGITRVIWLTYREAGSAGNLARFRASNVVLRAKVAQYPQLLQLADWAARSATMPTSWFSADGIHLGGQSDTAMASLIADALDVPYTPSRCAASQWTGTVPDSVNAAAPVAAPAGGVNLLAQPVRLGDTRSLPGKIGAGRMVIVPVAGANGVPGDATAALVTVTVIDPCATTYVAAFPCGTAVPSTSVVNATRGAVVANSAIVQLGQGAVCVFTSQASDLVIDLTGWVGSGGLRATLADPQRLVDTRVGATEALAVARQRLPRGHELTVDVSGDPDLAIVSALTVNVAAVGPAGNGFVSILPGPCTDIASVTLAPSTSNLNVATGRDGVALVTVALTNGQFCIYSSVDTDVVVDLQASYGASGASATPIAPQRLVDTRYLAPLTPGAIVPLDLEATPGGAPATIAGVVLNLTAVGSVGSGYITAFPCTSATPPLVSNVNMTTRSVVANAALVSTGGGHSVCLASNVTTDVVVDVEAWLA